MATVLSEIQTILIDPNDILDSQIENKEQICFLEYDDGFTLSPKCIIQNNVTAGIYVANYTREGLFFYKQQLTTDDYVDLKNISLNTIMSELDNFSSKSQLFKDAGIVHKRGIMFYGPPGCGKTSCVNHILKVFVEKNALVILVKNEENLAVAIEGIRAIKQIAPDRQIIIVIEEIDRYIPQAQTLLNFLDGQNSVQNIVVLATTNQIEHLPNSLLRPSRFDMLVEFKDLTAEERTAYLQYKKLDKKVINKWVKDTNKFSIAMLKELFIAVYLLQNDYDMTIKKLTSKISMSTSALSSHDTVGFKLKNDSTR